MQKVITTAEMRDVDRLTVEQYATPMLLLMEQAANCAKDEIARRFNYKSPGLRVRVFCGIGNNGGDGAALARQLWIAGAHVEVVVIGDLERARDDARTNFEIVRRLAGAQSGDSPEADERELRFLHCKTEEDWRRALAANELALHVPPNVIVDALFGTGLQRPLEGVYEQVVKHINECRDQRTHGLNHIEGELARQASSPLIVALDLPSGLAADSPHTLGSTVQADLTVTFTAPKLANVLPPAVRCNGELIVRHIGSPAPLIEKAESQIYLLEEADAQKWLRRTRYQAGSYKNTHGHVLVIAGSRDMSGAPILASNAALRAGAGLITVATPHAAHASVAARVSPEIMVAALSEIENGAVDREAYQRTSQLAERANTIIIGPGLTSNESSTREFVHRVVTERAAPIVIDADGLNALAPWNKELRGSTENPLILTPHEGEIRRLLGEGATLDDRIETVRRFATQHNLILLLKGERNIIGAPDGRIFIDPIGNPGLGTGGAGDTLTGFIGSFVAQEKGLFKDDADPLAAVLAAVLVSGIAGRLAADKYGVRTMKATDIQECFHEAVRRLDPEGERLY